MKLIWNKSEKYAALLKIASSDLLAYRRKNAKRCCKWVIHAKLPYAASRLNRISYCLTLLAQCSIEFVPSSEHALKFIDDTQWLEDESKQLYWHPLPLLSKFVQMRMNLPESKLFLVFSLKMHTNLRQAVNFETSASNLLSFANQPGYCNRNGEYLIAHLRVQWKFSLVVGVAHSPLIGLVVLLRIMRWS